MIRKQHLDQIATWFPDHKATLSEDGKCLVWANPKNGCYRCDYVLYRNCLFVTGDTLDAVFEWSANLTWEFLNRCDIGYAQGKCRCAGGSDRGMVWDSDLVMENLRRRCVQSLKEKQEEADDDEDDDQEEKPTPDESDILILDWHLQDSGYDDPTYNEHSWYAYLASDEDLELQFQVRGSEDIHNLRLSTDIDAGIGFTVSIHMAGAWIGLQKALEQLHDSTPVSNQVAAENRMRKEILDAIINEAATMLGVGTRIDPALCEIHRQRGKNGLDILANAFEVKPF